MITATSHNYITKMLVLRNNSTALRTQNLRQQPCALNLRSYQPLHQSDLTVHLPLVSQVCLGGSDDDQ